MLRLDLSGEVFAIFREAMAKGPRDAGESLDDDAATLLLCRQVLEGPKDPGRSSYQMALTVCESCRRAKQQGCGELIEVGPEILEMAECDGQHIGHVGASDHAHARAHVGAASRRATQTIPPKSVARSFAGTVENVAFPAAVTPSSRTCTTSRFAPKKAITPPQTS